MAEDFTTPPTGPVEEYPTPTPTPLPPPPPPAKRSNTVWIIVAVAAVLICCCCAIVAGLYFYGDQLLDMMNFSTEFGF
jgi:hypothetical protein